MKCNYIVHFLFPSICSLYCVRMRVHVSTCVQFTFYQFYPLICIKCVRSSLENLRACEYEFVFFLFACLLILMWCVILWYYSICGIFCRSTACTHVVFMMLLSPWIRTKNQLTKTIQAKCIWYL